MHNIDSILYLHLVEYDYWYDKVLGTYFILISYQKKWYLLLKHFKISPIQLFYSTIVNYRQSSIQLSKASDKNNGL